MAPIASAREIAQIYQGKDSFPVDTRRDIFSQILKSAIANNSTFLGIWSVWEPNMLDGLDEKFISVSGSTDIGRFAPGFYRENDVILIEESIESEMTLEDYYILPKKNMAETIMDPYMYSYTDKKEDEIMMTSVVVPIIENGNLTATVGIDFGLQVFDTLTDSLKPFETGYVFIVSNNGTFVTHPKKDIIGKNIAEVDPDYNAKYKVAENIKTGTPFYFYKKSTATGKIALTYFVPFTVGKTTTSWAVAVSVPLDTVMADTRQAYNFLFSSVSYL